MPPHDTGAMGAATSRAMVAAVLTVCVEISSVNYLPHGWLALFLSTFLGGIGYLSVLWLLGFVTEDEKKLARTVFRR